MSTPKTLSTDEANRLLEALLNKGGTPNQIRRGIRNQAFALVMIDGGLRVSEVTSLLVSDLIFNSAPVTSLLVRAAIAKNHIERLIPVTPRLSNALNNMLIAYWSFNYNCSQHSAFYSNCPDTPLTRRQVYQIISSAAIRSLGRKVHPHMLRHSFASNLMRVTSMRTVQELLGHKHLSSTEIYTHPNEQDKHQAIENMAASNSQ